MVDALIEVLCGVFGFEIGVVVCSVGVLVKVVVGNLFVGVDDDFMYLVVMFLVVMLLVDAWLFGVYVFGEEFYVVVGCEVYLYFL